MKPLRATIQTQIRSGGILLAGLLGVAGIEAGSTAAREANWKPATAPLDSPWTAKVDPVSPLPEHPRPDFRRDTWMTLNGLWDYALEPVEFEPIQGFINRKSMTRGSFPAEVEGKILVPFAIDSPLSGVMHVLRPRERLWYQRSFELPTTWRGRRVLLHFEASDWETSVYVNGEHIGQHRGGYDPFALDITKELNPGDNLLQVCVWDGTEQNCQPIGKQIMPEDRKGFRYQPTGGIWQTVWLEAVPETYLRAVKVTPWLSGATVVPEVEGSTRGLGFKVIARDGDRVVSMRDSRTMEEVSLEIPDAKLWTPDSPHLYSLDLQLLRDGRVVDQVESYLGIRTIERDKDGRILLNGKPAPLQFGPLDQGYWPDGILTPPHEDAIKFDLAYLKSIGCNMVRVHVTVHPQRWYYHADRLGLLVWQDFVCLPKYGQTVDKAASKNWQHESVEIINDFHNHPSIVNWVVFNEGWGQHNTAENTAWVALADPTRLVISASGWTDHGTGDILDVHDYAFYPAVPVTDGFGKSRALVFGELGGHNLLLEGHQWHPDQTQKPGPSLSRAGGRMNFNSVQDMAVKYPFYMRSLRHFANRCGYQGFVYTQITDVEHECNGWLTYDRRLSKLPIATFKKIHATLSRPIQYAPLFDDGDWLGAPVPATAEGPDPEPPGWTTIEAQPERFDPVSLPHSGGVMEPALGATESFGLRKAFTLDRQPSHALLEIRATHRDALDTPPPDLLDGHRGRARAAVPYLAYLDGQLLRRGSMSVERGQGQAVTFLELTDDELKSLALGKHLIAIELPAPLEVVGFDAKLWSYED